MSLKIFKSDILSLAKHFFAMAVALAICILPAFYAWVNIYANGNPYSNTGNIKIAVVSEDPGYSTKGRSTNAAEEIIENDLRKSDSIGWQFPEDSKAAIDGVKSGKYYAAVIFKENFSRTMYDFSYAVSSDEAPIVFYRNDKMNAVASKITDTAAQTLLESINRQYLEALFGEFFADANDLAEELDSSDAMDQAVARLTDIRNSLDAYDRIVLSFQSRSGGLTSSLDEAKTNFHSQRKAGKSAIASAEKNLSQARQTVSGFSDALDVMLGKISKSTSNLENTLDKLADGTLSSKEARELRKKAKAQADTLLSRLKAMRDSLPASSDITAVKVLASTLDSMIARAEIIRKGIDDYPSNVKDINDALKLLDTFEVNNLPKEIDSMTASMDDTLKALLPIAKSVSGMLDNVDPVLDASKDTVGSLDGSLTQLHNVLSSSSESLTEFLNKLESAAESDKLQLLVDFLGGDPARYADFFSSLVNVDAEQLYPVASYGAAMSPFYSALAFWVGGVILVAILKTQIDRRKFPEATNAQAYFGRFLIFFLIGQIQAAVIVLGDIFLLDCSPVHPWMFWFAASVSSFVFVLLIYSLTLSFGDLGKAIVVVIMVLQIAGSSGSYPIEILPEIFSKIYRFFPFPYSINAMREALFGTYGADYWIYLAKLMIFAAVALSIGLLARRSFIGLNRYVSEKIEETEVL